MARVFLARVDEVGAEAAAQALQRALEWLEVPAGPWTCVLDVREDPNRDERALPKQVRAALSERGGECRTLRPLPQGTGTARYQLTVGVPGEQLEAHEGLYQADPLCLVVGLRRSLALGGPGGALAGAARALLPAELDAVDMGGRDDLLAGLLEVADPDLVVGDGRRVALGAAEEGGASHRLGLLLVSDCALAADVVWAAILGQSDEDVPWIGRLARCGFGPSRVEDVTLGGEPLAFFARRVEGYGPPPPPLFDVPAAFLRATGVPLPVQVLPCSPGPATSRTHAWLAAHAEHPERRELLKECPPFALLTGPREPGALPQVDRLLTVGVVAAHAILSDVHVTHARRRPVWLAIVRGSSAELWDLTLSDGRTLRLAALMDPAPSVARIGRAAAVLTGFRELAWPRESRIAAVFGWLVRRLRRDGLPAPLVHARRIAHLQGRTWRAGKLLGPPLREDADAT